MSSTTTPPPPSAATAPPPAPMTTLPSLNTRINKLPAELIQEIASYLPSSILANLRLTCRQLHLYTASEFGLKASVTRAVTLSCSGLQSLLDMTAYAKFPPRVEQLTLCLPLQGRGFIWSNSRREIFYREVTGPLRSGQLQTLLQSCLMRLPRVKTIAILAAVWELEGRSFSVRRSGSSKWMRYTFGASATDRKWADQGTIYGAAGVGEIFDVRRNTPGFEMRREEFLSTHQTAYVAQLQSIISALRTAGAQIRTVRISTAGAFESAGMKFALDKLTTSCAVFQGTTDLDFDFHSCDHNARAHEASIEPDMVSRNLWHWIFPRLQRLRLDGMSDQDASLMLSRAHFRELKEFRLGRIRVLIRDLWRFFRAHHPTIKTFDVSSVFVARTGHNLGWVLVKELSGVPGTTEFGFQHVNLAFQSQTQIGQSGLPLFQVLHNLDRIVWNVEQRLVTTQDN